MFYNSSPAWWWIEVPNWGWFIPLWDNTFQGLCFTACSNKSIMMINSYKPFVFLRNKIKLIIMTKFSYKWKYWGYPPFIKPKLIILRFRKDKEYLFLCINKFTKIIFRIMRRNKSNRFLREIFPKPIVPTSLMLTEYPA